VAASDCVDLLIVGGGINGAGIARDSAVACVERAFALGINFIDTANVYSEGQSETILGQSLKNLGVARARPIADAREHVCDRI